jgi:hypothetical protein
MRYLNTGSAAADVNTAGSTAVEVVATDAFSKGDLAFMDYQTNTINNLKNDLVSLALTAGPTAAAFGTGQAGATAMQGTTVDLPDGTFIVAAASIAGGTTGTVTVTRYDLRGAILNRIVVETGVGGIGSLAMTLLTTGHIALTYTVSAVGGIWNILSQSLQTVYRGSSIGNGCHYIQETNDGGFFGLHATGITKVNADGTTSTIALDVGTPALQNESQDNQAMAYSTRCVSYENKKPISISSGGYGVVFCNSTSVNLVRLNADGTQRGATVILGTWASQLPASILAAQAANGNICWAATFTSNVGKYGIVADDGSIIKATTDFPVALGSTGSQRAKLLANAAGDFLLTSADSSGTINLNALQMTSAGVNRATCPKTLAPFSGNADHLALRLSTGIAHIFYSNVGYNQKTVFVANDGTVGPVRSLWAFGGGNNYIKVSAIVFNDKIYGVATAGNGGNCDMAIFTIDNTGAVDAVPQYTGVTIPMSGGSDATKPWVLMDPSNKYFNVVATGIVATYDLNKKTIQTYIGGSALGGVKCKARGYSIVMHQPLDGSIMGVSFLKIKSTVLLGVCADAAAADSKVTVNTKGLFFTPYKANRTFDTSGNNPPGNSGFISNGLINLKGF